MDGQKQQHITTEQSPTNVMGRDILHRLGIHLIASKPTGQTISLISDISIEQNITKKIFKKYPHL